MNLLDNLLSLEPIGFKLDGPGWIESKYNEHWGPRTSRPLPPALAKGLPCATAADKLASCFSRLIRKDRTPQIDEFTTQRFICKSSSHFSWRWIDVVDSSPSIMSLPPAQLAK